MKERKRLRNRMIFDLPAGTQMAIRLRAIKNRATTADVICAAMERAYPDDVAEAERALSTEDKEAKRK